MDRGATPRILVVEDERDVATTLKRVIESCGRHDVRLCVGGGDPGAGHRARAHLRQALKT
ncbi:MAG TPA: hypothetical protein DHV08_14560 [Rhodocyclaceae bacterium]|nr:MAG: hypothetical protein AUK49_10520 [Betaproteobacteria bacterium CG2_30_68_42]PIV75097.1 MAG: hypothetical protein COW56_03795 [Rhodocyclales bacterium CG17_big_fil_post_rev_8_21_14_2_50_68_7]PIX76430.1 MAG: hypothetical protein COZ38_00380 [Rhodocyclales bacterium CG_4_10_14_3_um_filter_68_10]PJA56802.1 MAG: hypothetical protein CO164_11275 [Rhodocyclales bacterium CG_4_9_14_3_um_filter_68_10]HCX34637.1 hypothetical protein [Rhodocyclaceae bacterium]